MVPRARRAALKALQIDDTLAEAHDVLGLINAFNYDWKAAEEEARRAIELKPAYPTAHHRYAVLLFSIGRTAQAVAEAEGAVQLDPTSLPINNLLIGALYYNREYGRAIEQAKRTLELDPGYSYAHSLLARTLMAQGRVAEAVQHLEKRRVSVYPNPLAGDLGYAYARSGRRSEALRELADLEERARNERISLAPARAIIHTGLGSNDEAFVWLSQAYEERNVALRWLKADPIFDSLRSDARFTQLLKKINLD